MSEPVKINVFSPTKPHAKQLEILDDEARFKLVRCGRKFRKTSLFVSWQIENALLCKESLTYPVILPFQEQARESVWNDHVKRLLKEFDVKGFPYKKNETNLSLEFPNGARFKLFGANNDVALRSSSNWGAVAVDEFDDWDPDVWDLTIRPNLITHKARAMVGGTPKGMRNMYKLSLLPEWKEFHFTSFDNPELDPSELNDLVEDAKRKGDDYYEQEIMAEYRKPYGLVYKEWDMSHFKEFAYDPNLPLHLTFDWGINDPTSVVWIQPTAQEIRVIDYYEASDANIEHFISVINSKPYKRAELYTGDPAGKARTLTTGTSVIEILAQKGIPIRVKDGVTVPEQIRLTHGMMSRLWISTKAERFKDCLLNYRYPTVATTIRNQENELPIHDQFSHAMRALEYWVVNYMDIRPKDTPSVVIYRGGDSVTHYGATARKKTVVARGYQGRQRSIRTF